MTTPLRVTFAGGPTGAWRIDSQTARLGAPLPMAARLQLLEGDAPAPAGSVWSLVGTTSNIRYSSADEAAAMRARQEGLGRKQARCAALIPISKSPEWWAMAQDERRRIFEETSQHIRIGMDYLPAIARRLHHGRDLGAEFDFLTWFDYAPEHADAFEAMCVRLRETPEWRFVTREIDIRLSR